MSKEHVSNHKSDKGTESSRTPDSEQQASDDFGSSLVESPSKMILRMQQTRGNAFVRRMLEQSANGSPALRGQGRANWIQRVQVRMDSGRSVGDGAAENIREEVLRVMDALAHAVEFD